MASEKQIEFFKDLTENQKDFSGKDIAGLQAQFRTLDQKSASAWIEKALTLPDKGATTVVPPTF